MHISQSPDGEVVSVPRSRTERTPSAFSRKESAGTFLGGGEAASEKGLKDVSMSVMERESNVVKMVARVPPLAPDDLGS